MLKTVRLQVSLKLDNNIKFEINKSISDNYKLKINVVNLVHFEILD